MTILPILLSVYNSAVPVAHAAANGLRRANLPGCAYGAIALALGVLAYQAYRQRQHEKAYDHTLHCLASAALAVVHFLLG